MTEEQKKYYNAMKKLGSKKPQKPIPRPLVSSLYRPRAGETPDEERHGGVTAEQGGGK